MTGHNCTFFGQEPEGVSAFPWIFDNDKLLERTSFALRREGVYQLLDGCIEALENRQLQKNIFKAFYDFFAEYICGYQTDKEDKEDCRDKPHPRRIITQYTEIEGLKQTVDKRKKLAYDQDGDDCGYRDKETCNEFSLERCAQR